MAKVIGILYDKVVYFKECEECELEWYCTNAIIENGVLTLIEMYDDNNNIIYGNEEN